MVHAPRLVHMLAAVAAVGALLTPSAVLADDDKKAVYTITNAANGNEVLAFHRSASGALSPAGSFPTGGTGTGAGLGSGHSLVVSNDGHELVVINAGSNSISAFKVEHDGLRLIGSPVESGGTRPTSVTLHDDLVYVLNAGSNSIAGFRLDDKQTGRVLIVDERGSSTIDTFVVNQRGVAGAAHTTPSNAGGPFGFDVDRRGNILFSAVAISINGALTSGATSYDVSRNGTLTANGDPVSSGQAAACWLAAADHFAYTTNAGSGSIGRFAIGPDGSLSLVGTTVVGSGSTPLDNAVSRDQDFMYVLLGGFHQIVGYRVGHDGALTQVTSVAVPIGAAGIAAR